MALYPDDLRGKSSDLKLRFDAYVAAPSFDLFVEFAVQLSSFSDFLNSQDLMGLHKVAATLESQTLSLFDKADQNLIPARELDVLKAQLKTLGEKVIEFLDRGKRLIVNRRSQAQPDSSAVATYPVPTHRVWFVGNVGSQWTAAIVQLNYFGIRAEVHAVERIPNKAEEPSILILETKDMPLDEACLHIQTLRTRFSTCRLIAQNFPTDFNSLKEALRLGCDFCFSEDTPQATILSKLIDLCKTEEESPYRVLVVEDSITASKSIQKTLTQNDVLSFAVTNPNEILNGLRHFQPDLILMDMHMPDCTGVEATRIIRQHSEFLSTPVIYLSGDADMALQIAALRLGGESFLTKPVNPVFLSAVVKSKIERYRALRRTMFYDGLTGLLNHRAIKERLVQAIGRASTNKEQLSVAMIDIDNFKKVNDTYGHPAGDQVIRSLAWMVKQRLRKTDIVGRYGGEEFMVILPGADCQQAFEVLDRIRRDFGLIKYPFNDGWFDARFSAGLSGFPTLCSAEALTKDADEALYDAKHNGRNCIMARG